MALTATLVDTCDTLDLSVWSASYGEVSAVGGRFRITAAAGTYAGIVTARTWTLSGSSITWQMFPLANPAGASSGECYTNFFIESSTNGTRVGVYLNADLGTITFDSEVGYFDAGHTSIAFDPVAHAYCKMLTSGGNLLWQTAPDGTTWTTRRTLATPAWVTAATNTRVAPGVFKDAGAKTFAEFDSINDVPSAPPAPVVDPAPVFGQINGAPHMGAGRRVPLSVRLTTSMQDIHVTAELADIEMRSVVPGGFASCTIKLQRPLSWQPAEIDYYARLEIYDTRNGLVVWSGRLEDPGRSAGADGQVWEINAVGPSAYAEDRVAPIVFADSMVDSYVKTSTSARHGEAGPEQSATDEPGVKVYCPRGTFWSIGSAVGAQSYKIADAGGYLARIQGRVEMGGTDGNWQVQAISYPSGTVVGTTSLATGLATFGSQIGSGIVTGDNSLLFRMARTGITQTVPDDGRWAIWYNWYQGAILRDRSGNDITTGYDENGVYAHQVIIDLIGAFLGGQYDAINARVDTTYQLIDQFAYQDGASPGQIMNDLMLLEPAYYWAAWERSSMTDKHRFEWRSWPSAARYECDVFDGFDSPASAANLYNRTNVFWKDSGGVRRRRTPVETTVPVLDDAGLLRERPIELGAELGSNANALRVGQGWLAENANPPNAGTLIIARPILDLEHGRMVAPWEVRPGNLVRVRGILPRPDSLNTSGRDGVTTFRIVGANYRSGSNTVELELDAYPASVAHALATLNSRSKSRSRLSAAIPSSRARCPAGSGRGKPRNSRGRCPRGDRKSAHRPGR